MRSFAVIPAAGRSVRMGRAKLLLPWNGGTVMGQVLAAWRSSLVTAVAVVVHPDDAELAEIVLRSGAELVMPRTPPPEMRVSVEYALEHIRRQFAPADAEAWLLAPADMPLLRASTIDRVLAAYDPARPSIVAPHQAGKRGHPVLLPWSLAAAVQELGPDQGINRLLSSHPVLDVEIVGDPIHVDLDTPDDYRRLRPDRPG